MIASLKHHIHMGSSCLRPRACALRGRGTPRRTPAAAHAARSNTSGERALPFVLHPSELLGTQTDDEGGFDAAAALQRFSAAAAARGQGARGPLEAARRKEPAGDGAAPPARREFSWDEIL
jgi:hypothetical protein